MPVEISIFPDLQLTPWRFAWHGPTRTAIVADLHLSALPLSPLFIRNWSQLAGHGPRQIVLAGDVLDQPQMPEIAWDTCRQLLQQVGGARVRYTPGNHDPENLAQRLGVSLEPAVRVGQYVVTHGHLPPGHESAKAWIVGHQHPAVVLRNGVNAVKMHCYAVGEGKAKLIVLPAFNAHAGGPLGSVLKADHWILPVPMPARSRIRIYGLVDGKEESQILDFGRLSDLDSAMGGGRDVHVTA